MGLGGWEVRVGEGMDLQVDELAFVVFHDCCGFWGFRGRGFLSCKCFGRKVPLSEEKRLVRALA